VPATGLPPRQVTLLLCDGHGTLIGTLPAFEVELPWWQEVADVVSGADRLHGLDVTVLRLLTTEPSARSAGGPVTYLAEVASPPPSLDLAPWTGPDPLAEQPLRLPFAKPGGPAADLAWADAALAAAGRERTGPAVQGRTWNLSSIWQLPTAEGTAWLKVVPPFFAHEGAMLERLDPEVVPPLIAAEGPRILLAHVAGEDHWGAELPVLRRVVELLVGLQSTWFDRVGELEEVGAPDWRANTLGPAAERLLSRDTETLADDVVARLRALVDGLPQRFADVAECGLPDTLVHGDFHPGNTRGSAEDDGHSVLLDWGDCGIGNPLLDQAATLASIREEQRAPLRTHWAELWRAAAPGSDPQRAASLVAPISALRQALIYRMFLDNIEPDERVYHADDPAHWMGRAAELAVD